MKDACLQRLAGQFTIVLMCRVLAVSRPGYYAWRDRRPSGAPRMASKHIIWYNEQRLHSTLNYLSPAAYERQLTAA